MKPNFLICYAAAGLLLLQGCAKNIATKQTDAQVINSHAKPNVISGSYGAYEITNVAGGLAMEVYGGSLSNGGGVDQYTYYAGGTSGPVNSAFNNQVWQVIDQGTGYYKIMNLRSGKYLEAAFPGPQLWQNSADGLDAELWQITAVGFGAYKIINKANGLAATNHASSTSSGTAITEESFTGNTSQYWVFTPVTAAAYRDDAVVNFFHRDNMANASGAFDEGVSTPLSNGKVLWITQDWFASSAITSSGTYPCNTPNGGDNSGLLQPSITNWTSASTPNITTTNSPGNPIQLFNPPSGEWDWPSYGAEINGHVYVQTTEGSRSDYSVINQYIYDLTEGSATAWGAANELSVSGVTNQNLASGNPWINWSMGMVKPGDGYVYVFGSYNNNGCGTCSTHIDVYAARFPATASGVTNWTFWNGSSFAANIPISSMAKIGTAVNDIGSACVSYCNGKYILMSLDPGWANCTGSHNIYLQVSSNPFVSGNTNTFSSPVTVFGITDQFAGGAARFYTPSIHPEFVNGHNELLVTYCLNNSQCGIDDCQNNSKDANSYQVKGVRVPYSLIGL